MASIKYEPNETMLTYVDQLTEDELIDYLKTIEANHFPTVGDAMLIN